MKYVVKKPFNYAPDGVTLRHASTGPMPDDVPSDLVAGLVKEGFLATEDGKKALGTSAENKALKGAPENKGEPSTQRNGKPPTDGKGRLDGPTPDEYMTAGYAISAYPPEGWVKRSNHFDPDDQSTWPAVWTDEDEKLLSSKIAEAAAAAKTTTDGKPDPTADGKKK